MKRFFTILAAAAAMTACNGNKSETATGDTANAMHSETPSTMSDTSKMSGDKMSADTSKMMGSDMAKDGMMTMKDGKMMVMKMGKWEALDKTMTCTDGCKVMTNGEVEMKDGKKMKMTEGEMIDMDGHMMSKDGKMMDGKM